MTFRETLSTQLNTKRSEKVVHEMAKMLVALEREGTIINSSGRASGVLKERTKYPYTYSLMAKLVAELEMTGYLQREVRGKRTFEIGLTPKYREEGLPEEVLDAAGWPSAQPQGTTQPELSPIAPVIPTYDNGDAENEADILGARPGRLAARIERTIPEIVSNAVQDAIDGRISLMLGALGYFQNISNDEVDRLNDLLQIAHRAVDELMQKNTKLSGELAAERANAVSARTELNKYLRTATAGQPSSSASLTPADVPSAFRDLAHWALDNDFTIQRTRGGHLLWKHSSGGYAFSGTTPSDVRAPDNLRHDLERAMA